MIDEARGLLDQIGDVMREAEATGVRDHARMDELTSRYEEVHAKEMDAFDRWLAYERAHYGKK